MHKSAILNFLNKNPKTWHKIEGTYIIIAVVHLTIQWIFLKIFCDGNADLHGEETKAKRG